MTVLRRLDLALEPTKDQVLKTHNEFKSKMDNLSGLLTSKDHGSGLEFYNTSPYTMKMLLDDPKSIDSNFLDYLNGYSENVQDIIQKFKFRNQLETFETTGITFSLLEKFCNPKVELSPEKISPMAMGYMFEDLIRRFNEKTNAAAGRHFYTQRNYRINDALGVFACKRQNTKRNLFGVRPLCRFGCYAYAI